MEQLEKNIVREDIKRAVIEKYENQVEGVNGALQKLKAEGIPTDLPTLKKIAISEDAFKSWLDKAISSYIGKLGFIPIRERKRIKESFYSVKEKVSNPLSTVGVFLVEEKYPIVQHQDGSLDYDWAVVEKDAEAQATKYFSDEDREYFSILLQLKEAINQLEQWEKEHTYTHFFGWHTPFFIPQKGDGGIPFDLTRSIDILIKPDFKNWFQRQIGMTLGKMNSEALRMIREMADED